MNKLLSILVLCVAFLPSSGTAQTLDRLVVWGDTLRLYGSPLTGLDSTRYAEFQQRLDTLRNPRPSDPRLYGALWRAGKDSLRLEGIYDTRFRTRLAADSLFAPQTTAAWFSGELRAAQSDQVVYTSGKGVPYFQHEIVYTIDKGRVAAAKKYRNDVVGSQKTFYDRTLPAIAKAYVFPDEPSSAELRNVYIAFAVTPDGKGVLKRFDLVRIVLYHKDGTTGTSDDPFHPYAQALLNRLIDAEPYAATIHGKVRAITGGVTLTPPQMIELPEAENTPPQAAPGVVTPTEGTPETPAAQEPTAKADVVPEPAQVPKPEPIDPPSSVPDAEPATSR